MKKKREGLVTERDRYERESARVRASELFIETVRAIESERERQSQREKGREGTGVGVGVGLGWIHQT